MTLDKERIEAAARAHWNETRLQASVSWEDAGVNTRDYFRLKMTAGLEAAGVPALIAERDAAIEELGRMQDLYVITTMRSVAAIEERDRLRAFADEVRAAIYGEPMIERVLAQIDAAVLALGESVT